MIEQVRAYAREEDTLLSFFLQLSWGNKKKKTHFRTLSLFIPPMTVLTPPPNKRKKDYFITDADLQFKRWSAGQKWACGSWGGVVRRWQAAWWVKMPRPSQQRQQRQLRGKKNLPVVPFTLLHPNPSLPLGNEPHLYTTLNTREKL